MKNPTEQRILQFECWEANSHGYWEQRRRGNGEETAIDDTEFFDKPISAEEIFHLQQGDEVGISDVQQIATYRYNCLLCTYTNCIIL